MGAIDTLPAINDTRCCDERRRGRGEDGEREGGGRKELEGEEVRDNGCDKRASC